MYLENLDSVKYWNSRDKPNSNKAEEICLEILQEELQRDHPIHRHCYEGSLENAKKWANSFPNAKFGKTLKRLYSCHSWNSAIIPTIRDFIYTLLYLLIWKKVMESKFVAFFCEFTQFHGNYRFGNSHLPHVLYRRRHYISWFNFCDTLVSQLFEYKSQVWSRLLCSTAIESPCRWSRSCPSTGSSSRPIPPSFPRIARYISRLHSSQQFDDFPFKADFKYFKNQSPSLPSLLTTLPPPKTVRVAKITDLRIFYFFRHMEGRVLECRETLCTWAKWLLTWKSRVWMQCSARLDSIRRSSTISGSSCSCSLPACLSDCKPHQSTTCQIAKNQSLLTFYLSFLSEYQTNPQSDSFLSEHQIISIQISQS